MVVGVQVGDGQGVGAGGGQIARREDEMGAAGVGAVDHAGIGAGPAVAVGSKLDGCAVQDPRLGVLQDATTGIDTLQFNGIDPAGGHLDAEPVLVATKLDVTRRRAHGDGAYRVNSADLVVNADDRGREDIGASQCENNPG